MKLTSRLMWLFALTLGLTLVGCSGSQQDEEQLQAEGQSEGQGDEEASEQGEQDEEELVQQQEEDLESLEDVLEGGEDTELTELPMEEAPATAAPSNATANSSRVVRYVRESGASAFPAASEGSSMGVFPQGTRLIVVEEGDWARVGDGMFVRASDLSQKPVPRAKKKAVWSHPAH